MGVITTTKAINLVGIGSLPSGVKVSFKANFKERNQGLIAHTVWYKDQTAYDAGAEIPAEIEGLSGKDNLDIQLSESDWVNETKRKNYFTPEDHIRFLSPKWKIVRGK